MMSRPIRYGGVTYPSQAALARTLGLNKSTVSLAVRDGWLDRLGSGGRDEGLSAAHRAKRQPVASLGWAWGSQRECAEALGVSAATVSEALEKGRLDALVERRLGPKVAGDRNAA